MSKQAKIKKKEFNEALSLELTNQRKFAERIDICYSRLSMLKSSNTKHSCSPDYAGRILKGFKKKYMFEDLFIWV